MKASQYRVARDALDWSHARLAEYLGKSERQSYRYANGGIEIPETVGKLLKRLVHDRLTMSTRPFDEMVVMLMVASAEVGWVPADVALPDSLRVRSRDDIQ